MKVAVGGGFLRNRKENEVKAYLIENGYEVLDLGQNEGEDQLIYRKRPSASHWRSRAARPSGESSSSAEPAGASASWRINSGAFTAWPPRACTRPSKIRQLNGANVLAMGKMWRASRTPMRS